MGGAQGVVGRCFDAPARWRPWVEDARHFSGQALDCGHHIAEEAPDAPLALIQPFFKEDDT